MKNVRLRIWEVHQSTGVFEHIVGYESEIELIPGGTQVELELLSLSTAYPDARTDDVNSALEHIRRGIASVVLPKGLGAKVIVACLYIHPVDFIPRMFERHTQLKLQEALTDAA